MSSTSGYERLLQALKAPKGSAKNDIATVLFLTITSDLAAKLPERLPADKKEAEIAKIQTGVENWLKSPAVSKRVCPDSDNLPTAQEFENTLQNQKNFLRVLASGSQRLGR